MKKKPILSTLPKGVIKPEENRKIQFTDIYGNTFKGFYIKEKDMFFVGFGLTGDFIYSNYIHNWKYIQC